MTSPAPMTHLPDGPADPSAEHSCATCSAPSRRTVLRGAGVATLGAVTATVLAACGGSPEPSPPDPGTEGSTGAGGGTGTGGAEVLAQLADIPVGGALSVTAADGTPMILTQPEAGTVVGLSAICTHQGCTVAPDGDVLHCPCHGSTFAIADGAVENGPATKPLPSIPVRVDGAAVVAA